MAVFRLEEILSMVISSGSSEFWRELLRFAKFALTLGVGMCIFALFPSLLSKFFYLSRERISFFPAIVLLSRV